MPRPMPPRLGYKKSRRGCLRCKARKVKCDERKPVCGWCTSRSLSCEYPPIHCKAINSGLSVPPKSPSVESTDDCLSYHGIALLDETSPQRRLLELGLLHYYIINVAPTFPYVDREDGLHIHADLIPQQGLRCRSLLNAMYAHALLHIHVENSTSGTVPKNVDFFRELGLSLAAPGGSNGNEEGIGTTIGALELHRDYLNRALAEQREAISDINKRNADAVCIASILIAMSAFVHASTESAEERDGSYRVPLEWFHMFRSFTVCLKIARPLLSPESATNKMINIYPLWLGDDLCFVSTTRFKHLLEWQSDSSTEDMDETTIDAYKKATQCVEKIYQYVKLNGPLPMLGRQILAFPNLVPELFVAFLEEKRPRALVILAYLLALTKKLDRTWWICRGVAVTHVKGLSSMVPPEWQWALAEPLQSVLQG